MNRSLRLLMTAAAMALLAACGAKGPLFLPEKPAPEGTVEPAAEAPVDAPASDAPAEDDSAEPPVTPPVEPPAGP